MRLLCRLIDWWCSISLPPAAQNKARQARKKLTQERTKETREELEALAQAKREKKLLAERESLKNLSGAERLKAEEKVRRVCFGLPLILSLRSARES